MLKIENLKKAYGKDKIAVNDLSLELQAGDLCGFIGANGAGKTTTIKSIVGIHDFDSGAIYIDGHSIKDEPVAAKLQLAYLPDNPDLYEHLTGHQYLQFIADVFSMSIEQRQEAINTYARIFEMEEHLNTLIASYSHGMQQRLALISAFIHKPKLLILDEPFVGLDPKGAYTVKEQMQQLCKSGSTIFFSTHVLEVAEKLCNKVAIMQRGKLVDFGNTQTIIQQQSLETVFMEVADYA